MTFVDVVVDGEELSYTDPGLETVGHIEASEQNAWAEASDDPEWTAILARRARDRAEALSPRMSSPAIPPGELTAADRSV